MRRGYDITSKYEKLKLKESLNRSSHYPNACKELAFIIRNAYSSSPKNLQTTIFQDTISAFRLLPQMQTQSAASAANLLLQSVEAMFPKQRKVLAVTEFRHAMIAHKKLSKAQNDDRHLGATQLPQDVLVHIFGFLDVWSLISAAAVCRLWNDAATENHLWESLYADFFDDCSPNLEVNQLNIGGVEHNADMKIKDDLVTQTKTNWKDAFKRTYKVCAAKRFNCHRGYCRHCSSLVWLSDTKFSSKRSGDNCKHHKVKPVSNEQILDFLLNDHFTTYSSDSDDDDDDDDKLLLKLWAYPSQMLPFIGSD
ncbi:hypothetical protein Leryth_016253 [Lithospermum erythrorhizon]|nr:hypothetical protein Leryth_016253 [Lithospermum erythrorhizon]